jgi:hypothetical protein
MADAKSICNLGLGKIAASKISSLAPPRSAVERHCAEGYPQWRDSELTRNTWAFALSYRALTKTGPDVSVPEDGRIYQYALPNDCMQPIRDKHTEWEQRGQFIYSVNSTLTLPYVKRANEADFHPLFVELLACRVAMECVEFATQSNTKGQAADQKYDYWLTEAKRVNAVIIGPQNVELDDDNDEWVQARMGIGGP